MYICIYIHRDKGCGAGDVRDLGIGREGAAHGVLGGVRGGTVEGELSGDTVERVQHRLRHRLLQVCEGVRDNDDRVNGHRQRQSCIQARHYS